MARSHSRREDDGHSRGSRYDRDRNRDYRRGSRDRNRSVGRYRSRSPRPRDLIRDKPYRGDDRDRVKERDRDRDRYRERERDRDRDRDRPRPRYDDDSHYIPRRDRSRGPPRKRSRDRSPLRSDRDDRPSSGHGRSRDGDDARDHKRRRFDDDRTPERRSAARSRTGSMEPAPSNSGSPRADLKINGRARDGRLSPKPLTAEEKQALQAAEEARAEQLAKEARQARLAAWKAKIAGESGLGIKQAASPKPSDDATPTSAASSAVVTAQVSTEGQESEKAPSAKFDPKEISRRAAAKLGRGKLDSDGVLSSITTPVNGTSGANVAKLPILNNSSGPPTTAIKPVVGDVKVSSFGLNKSVAEKPLTSTDIPKYAANFTEEDEARRKLEKLPDMPSSETADAVLANVQELQEDAVEHIRSDDEDDDEAARQAAQKRAQEAQIGGAIMASTSGKASTIELTTENGMDVDEDIDPLDAYMQTVDTSVATVRPSKAKNSNSGREVFASDDEEPDFDSVEQGPNDLFAVAAKRKKKDIPKVDHSKMQYEPIRKAFYSESVELANMTEDELAALRYELDDIKINGVGSPKPITNWSQGGFGAQILDVIRAQKFEKPTPIQAQTLPAIMSGRDTIGIAKTGSGKTVAYLLPMFRHIKDQRPLESMEGPIGLVLAPTRELATQIHRECKPYLKALNLRAVCAYGGAPIKDQIAELKRGAEIVVCTAGRMIDLLAANGGRVTNLTRASYIVLDEADRMFDMGFEPQISKILQNTRPDRQTVLFSATFPQKMELIARRFLTNPLIITAGGRSKVPKEITQVVEVRHEDTKFNRLLELMGKALEDEYADVRVLVFVERQETADAIFVKLGKRGWPSVPVHGGREQIDRDQAISDYKAGHYPIMVATSVAARGLDVKQLKLVVNYDSPSHLEDYVHRVGRTGRAGNTGTAVTFVTPDQDAYAPFLIQALKESGTEIPDDLLKLDEVHKEKVKGGDVQKVISGFGGRGIWRIDATHKAERARERKQYKTGEEEDDDDDDVKNTKDKKQTAAEKLVALATGQIKALDSKETDSTSLIPRDLSEKLERAKLVEKKADPPPNALPQDPLARAAAAAQRISSRVGRGGGRGGHPTDNRGPDAGAFWSIIEIHDFPQKARWAVTNRSNVAKILEQTGVSITSKGIYYEPPKQPDPNDPKAEPKLYLLVEADTEVAVRNAMGELTNLLVQGILASQDAADRGPRGRYVVA